MGDVHGPLCRSQSGKGCAVPLTSPIDPNCEEGGLKLNVSSEMTMHAIALGSALSFIGAVLAKLL